MASEAGTTCSCCSSQLQRVCSQSTPRPPPAALLSRSSATQVHQQGIQCERTLCVRRGQVAEHGRTPAVAARMPPAVLLVINLRIGTAAGCCGAAAAAACCCLIQSSQRPSEACRNRVVLSLLRLSAFKPINRSWMVPRVSLRRGVLAMAGLRSVRWRAERATKQRENHGYVMRSR